MPYTRLFYHFIWTTKERQPLIMETNREAILKAIAAKVISMGGICHAVNVVSDHAHLVASIPPSKPLGPFIEQVKGSSSHLASRLQEDGIIVPFEWQSEYGVMTVSESHLKTVVDYVHNQQAHHADGALQPKMERCED